MRRQLAALPVRLQLASQLAPCPAACALDAAPHSGPAQQAHNVLRLSANTQNVGSFLGIQAEHMQLTRTNETTLAVEAVLKHFKG